MAIPQGLLHVHQKKLLLFLNAMLAATTLRAIGQSSSWPVRQRLSTRELSFIHACCQGSKSWSSSEPLPGCSEPCSFEVRPLWYLHVSVRPQPSCRELFDLLGFSEDRDGGRDHC